MNGQQYIEHLKRQYCSEEFFNRPIDIHSGHIAGLTRVLHKSGIEIDPKKKFSASRVPVDAAVIQQEIDMLLHGIIEANPIFRAKIKRVPNAAILPTGSYDACALNAPNGDPICILDIKILNDLALVSRSLGQWVEGGNAIDLQKSVFLAVASCFSIRGVCSEQFNQIQVDSANRLTASTVVLTTLMTKSMVAFVLAHELSHHALGHLGHPRTRTMATYSRLPKLDLFTRSQVDELAADYEGMKTFLKYWDNHLNLNDEFDWHQVAPLFFFDVAAIVEEATDSGSNANRSHPPAYMRSDKLLQTFKPQLRPTALAFYCDVVQPFKETVRRNYLKLRPMFG